MTEIADTQPRHRRLAAILIGFTALIEVVLVSHHPVVSRIEGDPSIPFGGLAAIMRMNLTFHAILMLVVVGQFLGLVLFARRLGLHRPVVIAGLLFCGLAAVLMIIAMTFDGFVVYELISRCSASKEGCTKGTADTLRLAGAIIQGFTKLGFGAQCLGFAALGAAMWTLGGRARIAASACVIAAVAPVAIVISGEYLGPQQLMEILILLAVWGVGVAAVLVLGGSPQATAHDDVTHVSGAGLGHSPNDITPLAH